MKKLLIINADDLGYSEERDKGIIECYKAGAVTSASLMVNGVSAEFAAKLAREAQFKIGLHFNITEGKPLSNAHDIPTLLNQSGTFCDKEMLFNNAKEGSVNLSQVKLELERQIERFHHLLGYLPWHVDGHQHCHILPGIREVFADTLQEKGIKVTRVPYEKLTPSHPWPYEELAVFMKEVVQQAEDARTVYKQKGIWSSDGYIGLETMGKDFNSPMTTDALCNGLSSVFTGLGTAGPDQTRLDRSVTCELMTHPGYRTLDVGGCGEGPDTFSQSSDRENEMEVLKSGEMKDFYKKQEIELVGFVDCVKGN